MAWSCTIRVYAQDGQPADVSYEELSVGSRGGETTIGTVSSSELTSDLGSLLLEASDSVKIVGLTSIGTEPDLPEPEAEFLAMCWCTEHEYEAVGRFLATLDTDQRRQVFDLFDGFRNDELRDFCRELLSLEPRNYDKCVESIGDVLDRAWFNAAVADVTRRAAAEAARLEKKRRRAAEAHERIYGRPDEVRDPAGLVHRFGTKVPLGFLAHATQYPRPDLANEIVEALLLSWGTQTGSTPSGLWRHVNLSDGDLAFLGWALAGREEDALAHLGLRQDEETKEFFRKLNHRIAERTKSAPPTGATTAAIGRAIHAYYLKLRTAVPEAYR
jgi:hypothetical protein